MCYKGVILYVMCRSNFLGVMRKSYFVCFITLSHLYVLLR